MELALWIAAVEVVRALVIYENTLEIVIYQYDNSPSII